MITRACLWCAAPFPVPANNPHRRFCSPRCRVADWHFRHDRPPGANAVSRPNAVATPNASADPNATGLTRCPHCRRPLVVLTVVVPPAAAVVPVPPPPDHARDTGDA